MMRMARRNLSIGRHHVAAIAMAAVAATVLAGCAGAGGGSLAEGGEQEGSTGDLIPVKVSLTPVADMAPYWLGVAEGFFEDEGLDVTIEPNQGGAAALPAVMSGQFQFSSANPNTLFVAADQGLEPRILLTTAASTGVEGEDTGAIVVPDDSAIQGPADLAGHTVAIPTFNSINEAVVGIAVDKAGGDVDDVEFVEVPFPDMPAALSTGQVDAVAVVEPFLSATLADGGRAVSWMFQEANANLPITLLYTTQQYVEENPDIVDAFTAAARRSFEYATENEQEAREILTSYTKLSPEQIDSITLPRWPADVDVDAVSVIADWIYERGTVDEPVDISSLLVAD